MSVILYFLPVATRSTRIFFEGGGGAMIVEEMTCVLKYE